MDLHYPLELDGKDIRLADNRNLAITEVLSPLLTELGERPLIPDYGGKSYLFDPTDTQRLVSDIIKVTFQ